MKSPLSSIDQIGKKIVRLLNQTGGEQCLVRTLLIDFHLINIGTFPGSPVEKNLPVTSQCIGIENISPPSGPAFRGTARGGMGSTEKLPLPGAGYIKALQDSRQLPVVASLLAVRAI